MKIGINGLNLIKESESFRAQMYYDSNHLPTIGYGTLIDTKEEQYLKTATINESQALDLLRKDCAIFEKTIEKTVMVSLNQNQFDALMSLVYNIGPNNFQKSSVLGSINRKASPEEIKKNWALWRKADGKVLKGLVDRRNRELKLFYTA
jgi:lysozyme